MQPVVPDALVQRRSQVCHVDRLPVGFPGSLLVPDRCKVGDKERDCNCQNRAAARVQLSANRFAESHLSIASARIPNRARFTFAGLTKVSAVLAASRESPTLQKAMPMP